MLDSTRKYVSDRRKGLTKAAGYAGGLYLLSQYVSARIEDFREKVKQERAARENLRRRFEKNQEDMNFTVMTLVPTLGMHILQDMDVEALTHELQAKSRLSRAREPLSQSISSIGEPDARSDIGSASIVSYNETMAGSSSSWVDEFAAQARPGLPRATSDVAASTSEDSNGAARLSDSMLTTSSAASAATESGASEPPSSEGESSTSSTRSKAELWKEIKMLAFTRTLTTLYSLTLLTLFTQLQLTILGRHKYVQSVIQQEREERMREKLLDQVSISSLFWEPPDDGDDEEDEEVEMMGRETERKFLTLSWWIVHVGWKDVGERVKRGVEEVFEGVSLKSKLGAMDVHRLIGDVRRRVEHEVTFEGTERRINFLSTLLPPTAETLQHVLQKGGAAPSPVHPYPYAPDPVFTALLSETRDLLASPDFAYVLEACLDKATEVLVEGLRKNVFVESERREEEEGDVRIRLAGMLPGLARWSKLAVVGMPNELVDGLLGLREVRVLSAIVFSKFEDRFR
ncbi:Peroxin-3 [Heliocybe sulcata]|uniref:Peroxin-3 n=1 Tax=Heliocybe sulcata TaxID=5364 RepID=A0A5C3NA74_9AGAM|nr:Peroxin-3 [Heliocybe sulcata]